jgi:hypothetical protein
MHFVLFVPWLSDCEIKSSLCSFFRLVECLVVVMTIKDGVEAQTWKPRKLRFRITVQHLDDGTDISHRTP